MAEPAGDDGADQPTDVDDAPGDALRFTPADSYTVARDYAYPSSHPLHMGPLQELSEDEYDSDEDSPLVLGQDARSEGPPFVEDPSLMSPVITTTSHGDKEYQFSIASSDEIHGRAVALFDFEPENDNEVPLKEGQHIWISYRHGLGWLVAQDPTTGESGLVPEEYVEIVHQEPIPNK
ncbi:uncharacterized protein V1510DRAFT_411679 [Dipodascopsis tothii]|uniref:uncharacterized protein n=1 Tax=Dipodascopsis tothii TaxID=44089 RepID=UPI0034CEC333